MDFLKIVFFVSLCTCKIFHNEKQQVEKILFEMLPVKWNKK